MIQGSLSGPSYVGRSRLLFPVLLFVGNWILVQLVGIGYWCKWCNLQTSGPEMSFTNTMSGLRCDARIYTAPPLCLLLGSIRLLCSPPSGSSAPWWLALDIHFLALPYSAKKHVMILRNM